MILSNFASVTEYHYRFMDIKEGFRDAPLQQQQRHYL